MTIIFDIVDVKSIKENIALRKELTFHSAIDTRLIIDLGLLADDKDLTEEKLTIMDRLLDICLEKDINLRRVENILLKDTNLRLTDCYLLTKQNRIKTICIYDKEDYHVLKIKFVEDSVFVYLDDDLANQLIQCLEEKGGKSNE